MAVKFFKKTIIIIAILSVYTVGIADSVYGSSLFKKAYTELDTVSDKIYKVYNIGDIQSGAADDNYNLCSFSGTITEIDKKYKNIQIKDSSSETAILIDTSKIKDTIKNLKVSDLVQVYGIANKGMIGDKYSIKAANISTNVIAGAGNDIYCMENGRSIKKSDMVECSLDNGQVKYYIPKYWKAENVEFNIQENDLGYIEGYQYVLNRTPGSDENEPESFFVCYFKYDGNLRNDTSRSAEKPIEKAIVKNIENQDVGKFPTKEVKSTYYGRKYNYYSGQYNDVIKVNDDYHTEYIFESNGEDGIVMYLYVYKKPLHKEDIMLVLRFLEI